MISILLLPALAASPCQLVAPSQFGISFAPGVNEPALEIVTGEFNDTSLLDLAALRGETVSVAFDPGLGEASGSLNGSYSGLARSLLFGGERIVTAGAAGLQAHIWRTKNTRFRTRDLITDPIGSPAHTAWVDASTLRSGELGGGLGSDLAGVTSNGTDVVVGLWAGQEMVETQVIARLTSEIRDLCLADGDGDGINEIWVATDADLRVYEAGGMLLAQISHAGEHIVLARLASASGNGDNVAHIARGPLGRTKLKVLDGADRDPIQELDVDALQVIAGRSAYYDGDTHSDLVLTSSSNGPVAVLLGGAAGFSLAAGSVEWPITGSLPTPDPVAPGVFDLDHDGDSDLGLLFGVAGTLHLARSLHIDGSSLAPRFLSTTAAPTHLWFNANATPPQTFNSSSLRIDVGDDALLSVPSAATHVEVLLWVSRLMPNGQFRTDATPVEQVAIPVSSTTSRIVYVDSSGDEHVYFERDMSFFAGANETQDIHFVTARFVRLDALGRTAESWPHRTMYYGVSANAQGIQRHDLMPFTTPGLSIFAGDPWSPLQSSGGTQVGGGGTTGCVPAYPPGTPPNTPPPPVVP